MNKQLPLTISLSLLFGSYLWGQNVEVQDADYLRIRTAAEISALADPARATDRYQSSRTQVTISALADDYQGARRVEEGAGKSVARGLAQTFLLLDSQTALWGRAGITVGQWLKPRWNESADYYIVRPYITADSVGGNMQIQSYRFDGGYVRKMNDWSWGIQAGYRAEVRYRTSDPRPQNEVGHIQASLGLGWRLSGRYILSASLSGESYSQSSTLVTYRPGSAANTYQRQGFDLFSLRFMGNQRSMRYRGEGLGGTLSLSPDGAKAPFFASITGAYLAVRHFVGFENSLPIDRIVEKRFKGAIARRWGSIQEPLSISCGLEGTYTQRQGYETVFGAADLSDTQIIGERQPYKSLERSVGADFSGHYRTPSQRQFLTHMAISLRHESEEYETSFRQRSLYYVNTRISFAHRHKIRPHFSLGEELTISSRYCIRNKLTASAPRILAAPFDTDARRAFNALIDEQTRLSRSYIAPGASLEATYLSNGTTYFLKVQGAIPFARSIGLGECSIHLGLYF